MTQSGHCSRSKGFDLVARQWPNYIEKPFARHGRSVWLSATFGATF